MSTSRIIAAIFVVVIATGAIIQATVRNALKTGEGWQERVSIHNNLQDTYFVVVDQGHMKSRSVYDQAAQAFCPSNKAGWPICRVVFYAPDDPVPPPNTPAVGAIIPEGYRRVLANYQTTQSGEPAAFGSWDCDRAGEVGAPASAICGVVRTYFDAVTQLSLRASYSVGCGWSRYNADIEGVRRFIGQVRDPEQRDLYERTSAIFYASGSTRPDNPADCTRLQSKIEADAVSARKVLGVASPRPATQRLRTVP